MRWARRPSGSRPSWDNVSSALKNEVWSHSASFGIRMTVVQATRMKRSGVRCFGSALATAALKLSDSSRSRMVSCGGLVVVAGVLFMLFSVAVFKDGLDGFVELDV